MGLFRPSVEVAVRVVGELARAEGECVLRFLCLKSTAKLIFALYDNDILEVINNKKKLVNNNKKSATNLCECEDVHFPIKIVFWIYL